MTTRWANGFTMGCIVDELTHSYMVYCNHCEIAIGSMTYDTVKRAIFNGLGRGGGAMPDL